MESRGSSVPRDRTLSTRSTGKLRTAEIKDERGRIIFQQIDCEVPRAWSQLATNVVVSKYFYGDVASGNGSPARASASFRFAS